MILKIYNGNNPNDFEKFEIPYTVIVNSFLDEELDLSPIEIKHVKRSEPFAPFSVASLQESSDGEPTYWMVGSDDVLTNVATGLSDHVIQLIEPTKWLERFMVGNKAVTQPMSVNYVISPSPVEPDPVETKFAWYAGGKETIAANITKAYIEALKVYWIDVQYKSPLLLGRDDNLVYVLPPVAFEGPHGITVVDSGDWFSDGGTVTMTVVLTHNGVVLHQMKKEYRKGSSAKDTSILGEWRLLTPGLYNISYRFDCSADFVSESHFFASYDIAVVTSQEVEPQTLKDAATSMICAAEILKVNNGTPLPKFVLNDVIAKELDGITSPEIAVTNATLREALDEIGKCIGAITVLNVHPSAEGKSFEYEITYEKYCKKELADLTRLGEHYEVRKKVTCDDFATLLDATVENLVQYGVGSSLYDPSFQLWRTVRSEDVTYRVTEGTAEIFTAFPIERIDNLICAIEKDGALVERDITAYVFESSEYATLSSYSQAYPYTKALALCYTIGQKNITGLNFTAPNPIHEIFEKAAIINIINREFENLGMSFGAFKELDFTKLLFRVKYVPTGVARVRMRKPNSYRKNESVLSYSQSSAKLDADAFGRSMLGALLRTGNPETVYSYVTPLGTKSPSKGERVGENGYISAVTEEYAPKNKKVTITVTEGFNRLSQFVGVDKAHRLFEISERLCLDRHIVYEDKCLISTERNALGGAIVRQDFLSYLAGAFTSSVNPVTGWFATTQGYDKNGNRLSPCTLPCLAYAMGTALVFSISFQDNYSAGRRIDTGRRPIDDGKDPAGYYATETDVRYTDLFGRIASLELRISDKISEEHIKNISVGDYLDAANSLPEYPEILSRVEGPAILAQGVNRLYIDKDSREAIKTLTYQISFLEDDGIKISPWFVENLPYVGKSSRFIIVPFEGSINNLTEWVTVPEFDSISFPAGSASVEGHVVKVTFTMFAGGDGWAAVLRGSREDDRMRFLFGKNTTVNQGNEIIVYFNFFH